jgi:hypothetical protein
VISHLKQRLRTLDLTPLAILAVLYGLVQWLPFGIFGWLQNEDGLIEWGAVACLFAASWLSWKLSRAQGTDQQAAVGWLIVMVACLAFAGEEIAWGERLHGWGLDAVRNVNTQGETTLHNIASFQNSGLLNLGFAGMGIVLAFASSMVPRMKQLPSPSLCLYFLIPGLWYAFFHACNHTQNCAVVVANHQEIYEALIALGLWMHTRQRWAERR